MNTDIYGIDSINFNGYDFLFWHFDSVTDLVYFLLMFLGGVLLFFIVFIIFIFLLRSYLRSKHIIKAERRKVLLRVQVPKYTIKNEEDQSKSSQQIQEAISVTENIFSAIGGLKAQKGWKVWWFGRDDDVSFEIVVDKKIIYFYVAVPKYLQNYLEEQIHAQHPKALIEEVFDYNIFQAESYVLGAYLKQSENFALPLKTYKQMEADPLNSILNALSKLDVESGGAVQYIVRSAPGFWHDVGKKIVDKMHKGKSLKDALKGDKKSFFSFLFSSSNDKKDEMPQYRLSSKEEEAAKLIEEKTSKSGLDVNIRLIVSAKDKTYAKARLNDLINAFNVYNIYEYGNSLKVYKPKKLKKFIQAFIYREFDEKYKSIFNTEEMASLFHFPFSFTEAPNIDWLLAKKAPAPTNVPKEGLLMGINTYRGKETEIRIKDKDRRRHMYVIGMTGTGKSWFIEGLAVQDILAGRGVCYIDPHGDAIDHLLARTPKERADDVIVFDPSDVERPMAMNLLEFNSPEQRTMVVNELIAIFDKLYDLKATGGPMFEQYFRNAALLMMEDPESGNTILDLPRILADEDYRSYKLSKAKNLVVKNFWEKEALKAGGEASLQNMVPYITSKLTPFIANDYMRPIIAQQKSAFNFAEAMNSNKIILVKLAKGQIGDMNASLLGMIVVSKILMAALSRASMPEDQRKDFYLYIDEFQNFLTDSIEVILSEARKYRLNLIIAHQYLGQLVKGNDTKFRDAIFGNVGTKISFRIGVEDAEMMAKEFAPVFNENDFLNCPKFNCFVKLLIDNANPPAFNMATIHLDKFAKPNHELANAIRQLSRLKYGRDRDIIEKEIQEKQLNLDL